MSDVAKLRSLLAEAREWVPEAQKWLSDPKCDLLQRIDAALAEPVESPSEDAPRFGCGDNSCIFKALSPGGVGTNGGCSCFNDLESWLEGEKRWNRPEVRRVEQAARMLSQRVHTAERERDEARAEVERLNEALRNANAFTAAQIEQVLRSKLNAESAYQRGAEAMREAAAACVERQVDLLMLRAGLAADIRALPLPKEES